MRRFRSGLSAWSADTWAALFQRAGARYVVLVTKHHDGFLLWPSRHANPYREGWHCERDLVGELAVAVRARGMRLGLYYSGGIDWTFGGLPVRDMKSLLTGTPQSDAYAAHADAHWRELIERYEPSVLWNDIGYPRAGQPLKLFADYYAAMPEGVVNNRFTVAGYASSERHSDFETPESYPRKRASSLPRRPLRPPARGRRFQERQPAAQRRTPVRRPHSLAAGAAAGRSGRLARRLRRGGLRNAPVVARRGCPREWQPGATPSTRSCSQHPARQRSSCGISYSPATPASTCSVTRRL